MKTLRTALGLTIVLTLLLGIAYPLAMTGLSQLLFPKQGNGSLIVRNGQIVGSSLIGQSFTSARYFHGRPSAVGYDASNSGGSNLGPTSRALIERLRRDRDSLVRLYPQLDTLLPADMLTTSGSGLDPDISVANARLQAPIVARANGIDLQKVLTLVDRHTDGRMFGFLGEPHVNVLLLNLDLDQLRAKR